MYTISAAYAETLRLEHFMQARVCGKPFGLVFLTALSA